MVGQRTRVTLRFFRSSQKQKSHEVLNTSDYMSCKNYCARPAGVEKLTNGTGRNNNRMKIDSITRNRRTSTHAWMGSLSFRSAP